MKRNLKALRRLRAIFRNVPAQLVAMETASGVRTRCGTAGCLLYWGRSDKPLQALLNHFPCQSGRDEYGLTPETAERLFAMGRHWLQPGNGVTKEQVLASLDRVIAGKPIKPYAVKP